MSKRLVRIFASQLPERLSSLLKTEVNVVLYKGNTIFGRLENIAPDSLLVRDLRNHAHRIALSDVEVVIYDHHSLRHQTA